MPSVTVKNIPDHAYKSLKQIATVNHRSINSEIICLIEKATVSRAFNPEHYLIQAKRSRQKTQQFILTGDILQKAKEKGRL